MNNSSHKPFLIVAISIAAGWLVMRAIRMNSLDQSISENQPNLSKSLSGDKSDTISRSARNETSGTAYNRENSIAHNLTGRLNGPLSALETTACVIELAGVYAQMNPDAAILASREISDPAIRAKVLTKMAAIMAKTAPGETVAWIEKLSPDMPRSAMLNAFATSWAAQNPRMAAEFFLSSSPVQTALLNRIFGVWTLGDSPAAIDFIKTSCPEMSRLVFETSFGSGGSQRFSDALHFAQVMNLPLNSPAVIKTLASNSVSENEFRKWCQSLTPYQQSLAINAYYADLSGSGRPCNLKDWLSYSTSAAGELRLIQKWALSSKGKPMESVMAELNQLSGEAARDAAMHAYASTTSDPAKTLKEMAGKIGVDNN